MEDDNIIPYETSPSLTVKQAVMYMLGYRGEYSFVANIASKERLRSIDVQSSDPRFASRRWTCLQVEDRRYQSIVGIKLAP